MENFKDVTFIIPVRFDSEDRRRNFKICIDYLLNNFDTNIIVLESDKVSNEEFVKSVSSHIKYVFEFNKNKLFHRTRLLNEMTKIANTNIIVNYDVDVIFPLNQYIEARQKIIDGADMVFPYEGKFYDIPATFFDRIKNNKLEDINLNKCTLFNPNSVGGAIFFNKTRYHSIGLENENFVSWGHEDWERVMRIKIMGHRMERTGGVLYHLTHSRTSNSSDKNPYYKFNGEEYQKIRRMNKEQLQEHINKWPWINSN